MPPPAVASTTVASICFCTFACISWACFNICCMFIKSFPFRGLYLGDVSLKHFQEALHLWLVFRILDIRRTLRLFLHYKRHRNGFTNEFTGRGVEYLLVFDGL